MHYQNRRPSGLWQRFWRNGPFRGAGRWYVCHAADSADPKRVARPLSLRRGRLATAAWLFVTLGCGFCPSQPAAAPRPKAETNHRVTEHGPHHRVWKYETVDDDNRQGGVGSRSYVELKSGMNVWMPSERRWVEASDEIELFQNGAVSRKAQHQVIFSPRVTAPAGTVDLLLPNNQRLRSRIAGVAYSQIDTGRSVFVAELKESIGQLIGRNQVVYPDAFDAIKADIRYTIDIGFFEQEVIVRRQLPPPEAFGLDPLKSQVEIWTEFLQAPAIHKKALKQTANPIEADEELDFGPDSMFFGASEAFKRIEDASGPPRHQLAGQGERHRVRAAKQWHRQQGKTFLIEAVPFVEFERLISDLPPLEARALFNDENLKALASNSAGLERRLPVSLAMRQESAAFADLQLASIQRGELSAEPGVVLDYVLANGSTNFRFRSDTTYYCTANAYFYGTTVFEGGNSGQILPGESELRFAAHSVPGPHQLRNQSVPPGHLHSQRR